MSINCLRSLLNATFLSVAFLLILIATGGLPFLGVSDCFSQPPATIKMPPESKLFLPNGSFELTERVKGVENAESWVYYGGFAPSDLSVDAVSGNKAMRIEKGFVRQRIPVHPEAVGKPVTVYLHAKGGGALPFWFRPYKKEGDKFIATREGWKGLQANFPLSDTYLPYTFTLAEIPEGTEFLDLNFGSYSRIDAVFDQVGVATGVPVAAKEPSSPTSLPEGVELIDVAPYGAIRTKPYATLVRRMVDSIPGTGVLPEKHPYTRTHAYEFLYDRPVSVAQLKFTIPSQSFVIEGDSTGDGRYDKVLAFEPVYEKVGYWGRNDWPWYEKTVWPPVKVHAVRLINYAKDGNNAIFDFKIMALADQPAKSLAKREFRINAPLLVPGNELGPITPVPKKRFAQGFHVEPWMFNMPQWLQQNPRPPLREWPPFRKMVSELKRMHCNLVWLFPPRTWVWVEGRKGTYPYDVMWPSEVFQWSHPEHLLREFTAALHDEGMKVFVQYRFPDWKKTARPEGTGERPVLDWYHRTSFTGAAVEMAGEGVDGVPLCLDEEYFGGASYPGQFFQLKDEARVVDAEELEKIAEHNLKVRANREAFTRRWRTESFPDKLEDTELFRKWVIFYYEQVADSLNETARAVKKVNPWVMTVSNIVNGEPFNDRYHYGWGYDLFGHAADMDYFGTDPYHTREDTNLGQYISAKITKSLIAANKKRSSIVTLNFPWGQSKEKNPLTYEVHPPISTIGSVLGSAMQGGRAFAFWRYNYAFMEGYDKYVEQVFGMLDTLAAWGGKDAHVPRDIAVLRSRASEDWWQLRVRAGKYDGKRDDEIMGYVWDKWVEEFLLTRGYPYELYYLDHPEDFARLSDFKLVILPFPYALSKEAYDVISEAVARGTQVIVFKRKGEVDELGAEYIDPLFARMIDEGKIHFIEDDVADLGHFAWFNAKVENMIDGLLGPRKRHHVDVNGYDVQVGWLEKETGEVFVFLVNWDDREARVNLGITFPDGGQGHGRSPATGFRVLRRDLNRIHEMLLNGSRSPERNELRNFSVRLDKGESQILYISPLDWSDNWAEVR